MTQWPMANNRARELCRVPAIDGGVVRGFPPRTKNFVLCAPTSAREAWAGARLSVIDVDEGQEVRWSKSLPLVFGADLALDVKVITCRFQPKRAQRYIQLQLFSSTLKWIPSLDDR
jgi:hypothetical protein